MTTPETPGEAARVPDSEAAALLQSLEDLHARIAAIRPGLIVQAQFGDRIKPARGRRDYGSQTAADFPNVFEDGGTFRNHFDQGPQFDNVFDKYGDGWIDIHGIDVDKGLDVLPEQTIDLLRGRPQADAEG